MVPVWGLMGICPETKMRSPTAVTGEQGPMALGMPAGKTLQTLSIRYDAGLRFDNESEVYCKINIKTSRIHLSASGYNFTYIAFSDEGDYLQQIMNKDSRAENTEEQLWYIFVNNETKGPFSLRDLDVLLRTNDINSHNLAWKVGMKEWRVLNEIDEIKDNILESSKEMLEIEKKRQCLLEQTNKQGQDAEKAEQDANQIIENKDENALTILETTVENLLKKTFHQSTDGKWNIYDEDKGQWVQQEEEPTEKIQKMKQLLFNKLKAELFFEDKIGKRKKPQAQPQEKKQPEEELTQQQLLKRQKNKKKAKRQAQKRKQKWYNAKINTFVYISGLPLDITDEELKQFVVKAGVLRIDLNTGKEKLKIYRDENGFPKGDAAVSYAKEESVNLAIENLNDSEIRSGFKVKVQRAQFNQKEDDYKPRQTKKQSMAKKIQNKMREKKQFSWDQDVDEEGQGLKIVILKHIIDIKQSESEEYLDSVKKQITDELSKIGEIKRIRFYESHPEGVVEVKFQKQKDAESCIFVMNGRFYDNREIECDYWDGETDYKRDASSLMLQQERLEKFGEEVEAIEKNGGLQKIEQDAEQEDQLINKHLLEEK